jgi:glycosyltransferase involved in cell wall biosynthesis
LAAVFLLCNIPTPYRIPLFNEIHSQMSDRGLELRVLFGAAGYQRRKWKIDLGEAGFSYRVLPSSRLLYGNPENPFFTYSKLGEEIRGHRPLAIIGNGFSMATTKLFLSSFYSGIPYLIWSGATGMEGTRFLPVRRLHRKALVRKASGFVAYGSRAARHLEEFGADPERIFLGVNTVDTSTFSRESRRLREHGEVRTTDGENRLLYLGELSPRKNVARLFGAVAILARQRKDFVLDLVGDGKERGRLEKMALDMGIHSLVRFHGFQQKGQIIRFLAAARCLLFQTDYDIWGLVLNEGMAAGLPCLASIHAGATDDLITHGVTGFKVDFSRAEESAQTMNWILEHPGEAEAMGERARSRMENEFSLKTSAKGFVSAVEKAIMNNPQKGAR